MTHEDIQLICGAVVSVAGIAAMAAVGIAAIRIIFNLSKDED